MYLYIRKCRDNLILGRKLGALLELEIADGSGESEVAIYAAEVYKASCGLDTRFLGCILLVAAQISATMYVPSF
jgi:hypothetical protein